MKKMILLLLPVFMITVQSNAQKEQGKSAPKPETTAKTEPAAKVNGPVATWDRTTADYGEIEQGIPKVAEFNLTNSGNEPLLIASAQASCGCTNLQYGKDPIMPGKSTRISVTYNAAAKGNFMKTVTVKTSAGDQATVLWVKGTVVDKKVQEQK
jgi:hypothetical protein